MTVLAWAQKRNGTVAFRLTGPTDGPILWAILQHGSVDTPIKPLVVWRSQQRSHGSSKLAGGCASYKRVELRPVSPHGDDVEMIATIGLPPDVEAEISCAVARLGGQAMKRRLTAVTIGWPDVEMCDHLELRGRI